MLLKWELTDNKNLDWLKILLNEGEKTDSIHNEKYTIVVQCTRNNICFVLKNTLKGDFIVSQEGLFWRVHLRWFWEQSDGRLDLKRGAAQGTQNWAKWDYYTQVHSDQMLLVMVRQETGHRERRLKTLKGELENNSRKPRDLIRKLT
jgi:hypothetical protein